MCNPKGMKQPSHHFTEGSTDTALGDKMGMKVLESNEERTVIRMPVQGNTQVVGILHGGATAALCETAASTAAMVHADRLVRDAEEQGEAPLGPLGAVGTELTVSHLRPAREGFVTATAKSVHLGRRTTVHSVIVLNDEGQKVAVALATNMIVAL